MSDPVNRDADPPLVSVVIPVWRDADALAGALQTVVATPEVEVIVATALDDASRYEPLRHSYENVRWTAAPRGRARQMNAGAALGRGRWLLFLHADSRLPPEWMDVVTQADADPDVVAGAFRLALDSRDRRARIIELGARLRAALVRLPYGDQALFVRRRVFEAMDGYRDLPLMEDVDFVRRVRTRGRLWLSAARVRTSARRWERDGWFRRSAQNASLAARFLLGASPARLAQRYVGRRPEALVMMARAPWLAGKTRLAVPVGEAEHASLRQALFLDTIDVVASIPDVSHIVACEPAEACDAMRELASRGVDIIAQRGGDLGERLTCVFEDVFRLGAESVVVIGSDLPDLPPGRLGEALVALRGGARRLVVGPAADGGYYLVGMNRLHRAIFEGIEWSTDRVLAQTLDAARAADLQTVLLDPWTDVDDAAGLERIVNSADAETAPRTRAWGARQRVVRLLQHEE